MLNLPNPTTRQHCGAEPSPLPLLAFYGLRRHSVALRSLRSRRGCTHSVSSVPSVVRAFHGRTAGPLRQTASQDKGEACLPRQGSAFGIWIGVPRIMSTSPAKLDFFPTLAKSTTSNFLIDNFCAFLRPAPTKSTTGLARSSSLACPECSRSVTCHLPALRKQGPLPSNRHIPELESGLSHRKQRTGPLSNRHIFAFCNSCPVAASKVLNESSSHFRLSTLDCLP